MTEINSKPETSLAEVLALLETMHEDVIIRREGKIVAKLVGAAGAVKRRRVGHVNPKLAVVFHENPMTPLREEDWPDGDR